MIKLEVEDYCQNCSYFKPAEERIRAENGSKVVYNIIVRCKRRHMCKNILKHMKDKDKPF